MVVLVVVAVACFSAGVTAASRWLPDLEAGPVGTIAFFVVCGLSGASLGLIGIEVDQIVRALKEGGRDGLATFVVTNGLESILRDAGTLAALALIAYLLAPIADAPETSSLTPDHQR